MTYTITHSKVRFQYLNPRPEDILIEDIAHSLGQICRFTGHTSSFMSVAQHSIFVSEAVSSHNALWGLMHDAPEAYVNDLSSPLKGIIDGNYTMIHDQIMQQICLKWGLPLREPEEVKRMDYIVTVNELWALIDPDYIEEGVPRLFDEIPPWTPREAKEAFLQRFGELYHGCRQTTQAFYRPDIRT